MKRHPPRRFAIDQNFPQPILDALDVALVDVELVPVSKIGQGLDDVPDWELLRELHCDARHWDGLITNDDAMLQLPKEMTVLSQTGLTLVVVQGHGHSPIRATGLLLCHLEHICHQTKPGTPQVWVLKMQQKPHHTAMELLDKIAARTETTATELYQRYKLPPSQLARRKQ